MIICDDATRDCDLCLLPMANRGHGSGHGGGRGGVQGGGRDGGRSDGHGRGDATATCAHPRKCDRLRRLAHMWSCSPRQSRRLPHSPRSSRRSPRSYRQCSSRHLVNVRHGGHLVNVHRDAFCHQRCTIVAYEFCVHRHCQCPPISGCNDNPRWADN